MKTPTRYGNSLENHMSKDKLMGLNVHYLTQQILLACSWCLLNPLKKTTLCRWGVSVSPKFVCVLYILLIYQHSFYISVTKFAYQRYISHLQILVWWNMCLSISLTILNCVDRLGVDDAILEKISWCPKSYAYNKARLEASLIYRMTQAFHTFSMWTWMIKIYFWNKKWHFL